MRHDLLAGVELVHAVRQVAEWNLVSAEAATINPWSKTNTSRMLVISTRIVSSGALSGRSSFLAALQIGYFPPCVSFSGGLAAVPSAFT